jgi:lysophospholipase
MASSALFRRALPSGARFSQWCAPDGWPLRRFDLAANAGPTRGSIVFEGGRGDIVEKYLESIAHWHAAGWSVTSIDWRGQGGSGRMADDARVGHVDTFETYINDFKGFYADWAAQAVGPRVLIGHSMGGHLALRAMVERVAAPDAAVLIAPMLGLHSPVGARAGEWLAAAMRRIGHPARAAWKANEIPSARSTRQALLTHDTDRYADELWWHQAEPDLVLGPPSWTWLHAAFVSTRKLDRESRLTQMSVPTLMLIAEADRLVSAKAALAIAARLPNCETVTFGDEAAHEVLREVDAVRNRAMTAIDLFLDRQAPGSRAT